MRLPLRHIRRAGFTLVELLVAMLISSLLIGLTTSVYTLFRKSVTADQSKADISQNARIVVDRISRDLRQTPDIITPLPASPSDSSIPEPHAILFEDGHAQDLTYRSYYLSGSVLKLDIVQYYFPSAQGTRVHQYAVDTNGNAPTSGVISSTDVADHVQDISFYGDTTLLMQIATTDGLNQSYSLTTSIYRRN